MLPVNVVLMESVSSSSTFFALQEVYEKLPLNPFRPRLGMETDPTSIRSMDRGPPMLEEICEVGIIMRFAVFFLLGQRGSGGGQLHFGNMSGRHSGLMSCLIGSCGFDKFALDCSEVILFLVGLLKFRHQQVFHLYVFICC